MHWTIDMTTDGLLEARVSGELTAADLTAFVVALARRTSAARARRLLVDTSGLTSTWHATPTELRAVAAAGARDRRLRLQIGVVAPSADAFELGRTLPGVTVFRAREAATRFLAPSIP